MTALLLLACSDHGLSLRIQDPLNGEARIDVDPEEVDFFAAQAGEVLTRTVTVAGPFFASGSTFKPVPLS